MKILCFSDSHGDDRCIRFALLRHPDAELIIHLGDGLSEVEKFVFSDSRRKWLCVRGNCDPSISSLPELPKKTDSINIMGHRIVYTHGDLYGVKYSFGGIMGLAAEKEADLVLFGHTHIPCEKYVELPSGKSAYLFNPGSAGGDYFAGSSFGVITVTDSGILLSHGTLRSEGE